MEKISFNISARTAKLIGRENFSNPAGAIIELVKNAFDADARNCLVIFDIPYPTIPGNLATAEYEQVLGHHKTLKSAYRRSGDACVLQPSLSPGKFELLKDVFFEHNSIYIVDNGEGMNRDDIRDYWMEIGTGNKDAEYLTADKRVKTGAKGIGRFALDRLGYRTELWSVSKKTPKKGVYWTMDWRQFDAPDIKLTEAKAELDEKNISLAETIQNKVDQTAYRRHFNKATLSSGTIIKISNLKDSWSEESLNTVYRSLQMLIPPKDLQIAFEVQLLLLQDLKQFGLVNTAFFNEYDYKIEAKYEAASKEVIIDITRDELDLKLVTTKFKKLFENAKPPYALKTLTGKTFTIKKSAFELLKWPQDAANTQLLTNLGDFNLIYYFLKNRKYDDYPYKDFNAAERQAVLRQFGGIRIYRDSFRVRPYGDLGNDWLKLGERSASSPAGPGQRIGDWRVGPNQIAGTTIISRLENPNLIDKSDRGALIENEYFEVLKSLITGVINEFEVDRSIILNKFYLADQANKKKKRQQDIKREAKKLAARIVAKQTSDAQAAQPTQVSKMIVQSFTKLEQPEDDRVEIAQVRTLASLGLVVSSFAHELKEVKNNLNELNVLEKIYERIVPKSNKQSRDFTDGKDIFEQLKNDNERISHWVDYSMTAVRKDKRKRTSLKFDTFFASLTKQWNKVLTDRNVTLVCKAPKNNDYLFRAFEMDMFTIFSNLIVNSLDAFNNLKVIRDRNITILATLNRDALQIVYKDNGVGISKVFKKDIDEIFLPFTTSKKDRMGNDVGTGLGMYLVKSVVTDNRGTVEIIPVKQGFQLKITFPVRKN